MAYGNPSIGASRSRKRHLPYSLVYDLFLTTRLVTYHHGQIILRQFHVNYFPVFAVHPHSTALRAYLATHKASENITLT